MNNERLISGVIVVLILVVGVLGWLLGVSPILDQTNAAWAQRDTTARANTLTKQRIVTLQTQFANIDELQTKLDALRSSIPEGAAIPAFLAEINALCVQTGVVLTSVTINDAVIYVAPSAEPAPGATPTPTPSASATQPSPAVPADPGGQLVDIPVKVAVTGPYSAVMAFSGAMQTGTRLFLVTGFDTTDATDNHTFSGELTGSVFALPLTGGQIASKPKTTPTPSPTPSVSASSSPSPTP
jgi:Tfp pilus assembly protein PilO